MPLAISDEHRALSEVARSLLTDKNALGAARATLDTADESLSPLWKEVCGQGWLGLHLPESLGGQGYGLAELAVVLEELGRVVAPIPFVPTVLASAVLVASGGETVKKALVPGLASGDRVGAVGLRGSLARNTDGTVSGDAGAVLGAGLADMLILAVGDDLVVVEKGAAGLSIEATSSLDPTLRYAKVTCANVTVAADRLLGGARAPALDLARIIASAEAIGGAHSCLDRTVEYAKARVQFGRAIGTFQAVKHQAADMLVVAELATALVWDAARTDPASQGGIAAATAAAFALPAYEHCARKQIQLHGGIGFTWEHDAHLYLRRSASIANAYGTASEADADVHRIVASGVDRQYALELPPEAETYRTEARAAAAKWRELPEGKRRDFLVDSGYLVPNWPKPYGRAASAVEQLVIEQEFADVAVPGLGITGWNILTITQHGSDSQKERWVEPALRGEKVWCQLFSEPDAGSDAAAIKTRGTRVDGGWLVTGQKVWTSGAQHSQMGFATVRTDPDAPKHQGVTMMVIDMQSKGVEIRPLRELTGHAMFNEVFFDEVFVPDDDVVGPTNQGWTVARATLGNERVSIGSGSAMTMGAVGLLRYAGDDDQGIVREVGHLIAEEHAMRLLNFRAATRAVIGGEPGPEGNVTKLLSADHAQKVTELGMRVVGRAAVSGDDDKLTFDYLIARCLSIAGGTSEITRNQIAERLLRLPRDPLLK